MQVDKIRGLLEECRNTQLAREDAGDMEAYMNMVVKRAELVQEALSLLPKPCETCGGSGEVQEKSHSRPLFGGIMKASGTFIRKIPCPDCQAPATEIEEFMKELQKGIEDIKTAYPIIPWSHSLPSTFQLTQTLHLLSQKTSKACGYLTTQAKQIEQLKAEKKGLKEIEKCLIKRRKEIVEDERYYYVPAIIQTNAPLALIQQGLESEMRLIDQALLKGE